FLVTEFGDIYSMLDYLDPGTTLTVPSFRWGDTVEVVLECDDADGDDEAYGIWGIGPVDEWVFWNEIMVEEWTAISVMESANFRDFELTWSDGAFRGTMVIPHFLPEDYAITIMGVVGISGMSGPPGNDARIAILEDIHTLPPNPLPTVELVTDVAGEQFGGLMEVAGIADDDTGVECVEYRVDGGAWEEATGTDTWSIELDTTAMTSGIHQLEVRAFDGEDHSILVDAIFEVDQPPTVLITAPTAAERVGGTVQIKGSTSDDNEVVAVEWRIDGGSWLGATGTTAWEVELDTTILTSGAHTIEVRASDGEREGEPTSVSIVVDQMPTVSVSSTHTEGKSYKDKVQITGGASDDVAVEKVEVRLDNESWVGVILDGSEWSYRVPSKDLKEGEHTLE
ncbi:MAG: hypothetical protein KAS77_11545, partial [Thermoplasmata archaeon]|nr:hypothetical protein [Thermoplasmata archaeon]